jgi:hypothetical protein
MRQVGCNCDDYIYTLDIRMNAGTRPRQRNPTVGGELATNARRHNIETAIELE